MQGFTRAYHYCRVGVRIHWTEAEQSHRQYLTDRAVGQMHNGKEVKRYDVIALARFYHLDEQAMADLLVKIAKENRE